MPDMHLRRMLRTSGVVVIASLSFATAAHADNVISGKVVNAETKEPIPDVVVTATSPALLGERLLVTDIQGLYRIPELPPGLYTLRFDKEGFKPFSRSEIDLRPDRTVQVNVELLGERFTDVIYIGPCGGPLIDVSSATTGQYVDPEDFTRHIAVNRPEGKARAARSFEALAELVPGTQGDVHGVSINGASPLENGYVVDGVSTQDPVFGFNASPLSVEFLQELQVITGGYMPEYGRATGGILRALTRSGSNEFHGSVFGNWAPGVLAAPPTSASARTSTISGRNALGNLGDVGATLGGPLVKDRLWFFAGVAPSFNRVEHTRTLNALMPGQDGTSERQPIPGTSRTFFADERGLQAMGKLTYLFHQDHSASLSFITTPSRTGGAGQLTVDPLSGSVREILHGQPDALDQRVVDRDLTTTGLKYTGTFLDRQLFVDAHLGWSHQTSSSTPLDDKTAGLSPVTYWRTRPITYYENVPDAARYCGTSEDEQLLRCPVPYYEAISPRIQSTHTADRYQGNVQATWLMDLAGYHVLKAGVDAEHLASERTRTLLGGGVLGGGSTLSSQTSRYSSDLLGGFVQDSWTVLARITVNAGVRYDTQWLYQEDGALAFALRDQLSPRLGIVVDPMANGRMKLFAHAAKYRGLMPLGLMERAFSGGGRPGVAPVDADLVPPSTTELVAGTEYELPRNIRFSAHYTHRRLDSAIEDLSRDDGNTFFVGNPGVGLASDFPQAERTHDAVTVALSHDFREGWLAQASYTWSRSHGNYLGPTHPVFRQDGLRFQGDWDLVSSMENRTGLLPYDRTHTFKLFGARELQFTRELSASLGLSYLGRSGTPINYLGGHPLLGEGETFVLPRGSSGERTPWVHVIDSSVGVDYRLGRGKVVSFTLDVFNLFNFQQVTQVDENYTSATVLPLQGVKAEELTPDRVIRVGETTGEPRSLTESDLNPSFKKPLQYQTPRQVRLGLRYVF